ncbi:hypothetical protein HMI54_001908 [Coelomomyces lativittatus]|nr:hypothetical protein HMI54_001908 [Coelomomyces lativittatus]
MKGQMLLLRLAKAFFIFGAPLYRIEVRVKSVASHIGIPLSILTFPTSISLFFGDGTHVFWPQSFLIKGTQRLNMAKLQAIDRWAIKLSGGEQKAVESQIRERLIQSISECQEAQKEKYKRNPPSSSSSSSASPPLSFHPPFSQHSSYHSNSRKNYPHHSPHIEKSLKQVLVNPRPTLAVSEREMDIYLEELDKVVSQADVFHSNYRILSTAIIGSLLYTISYDFYILIFFFFFNFESRCL